MELSIHIIVSVGLAGREAEPTSLGYFISILRFTFPCYNTVERKLQKIGEIMHENGAIAHQFLKTPGPKTRRSEPSRERKRGSSAAWPHGYNFYPDCECGIS